MVKKIRYLQIALSLLIFSLLLLLLISLPIYLPKLREKKSIKIGVVQPLTGALSTFGESGLRGAKLAVEEINEKGGILGMPVELVIEDFGGDPKIAISAAEKLITVDNVTVLIGGFSSSACLAISTVAEKHKIPYITIGGMADEITARGYRYTFRMPANSTEQAELGAEFIDKFIHPKTIAVLYENTLMGKASKEAIMKEAEKYGWKIVLAEPYEAGGIDFKPILEKVKAKNPEVLVLNPYLTDGVLIAKQMKEINFQPKAVVATGGAGPQTLEMIELAGDAVKYWFVVQAEFWCEKAWPEKNEVRKMCLNFWKKFNRPLDFQSWAGYADIYLIKNAIEKCRCLDREKIRDEIAKTSIYFPWFGNISFYPNGHRATGSQTAFVTQVLPARLEDPWQAHNLSHYAIWPESFKVMEPFYS